MLTLKWVYFILLLILLALVMKAPYWVTFSKTQELLKLYIYLRIYIHCTEIALLVSKIFKTLLILKTSTVCFILKWLWLVYLYPCLCSVCQRVVVLQPGVMFLFEIFYSVSYVNYMCNHKPLDCVTDNMYVMQSCLQSNFCRLFFCQQRIILRILLRKLKTFKG